MFEIEISICDRFQMNPFQLNRETAVDIIYLINDLTDYNSRKNNETPNSYTKPDGTIVEVKQAGDDWF